MNNDDGKFKDLLRQKDSSFVILWNAEFSFLIVHLVVILSITVNIQFQNC